MIDADKWWTGTNAGGYTTVGWETGAGKGLTFTPAGGDTAKRLFIPNAGRRPSGGSADGHGTGGFLWSAIPSFPYAWRIQLSEGVTSGAIALNYVQYIESLRCVRS